MAEHPVESTGRRGHRRGKVTSLKSKKSSGEDTLPGEAERVQGEYLAGWQDTDGKECNGLMRQSWRLAVV